jgi:O-succinylbenzoic acid--CoA ligase
MVNQWIVQGAVVSWPAFLSGNDWVWLKSWLDGADIMSFMTSGTTGAPKEVVFTRRQIEQSALRTARCFSLEKNQNVLHTLPFGFVAGRMNIVRAIILKQNVFSLEWKELRDWQNLSVYPIHWWTTTPMMIQQVMNLGARLDFIQKILLGGGAIPEGIRSSVMELKAEVYESYGMTETLTHIAIRQLNKASRESDFFTPILGVSCSLSSQDTLVVDDAILGLKVITQDLVKFNEHGAFEIMGRADDVINSGGVKIFPKDVEDWMRPFMQGDFAIVKAPHPILGQQVICLIISSQENLNEDFWRGIFSEHPLWRPKQFIKVERLPFNTNGKMNRNWSLT